MKKIALTLSVLFFLVNVAVPATNVKALEAGEAITQEQTVDESNIMLDLKGDENTKEEVITENNNLSDVSGSELEEDKLQNQEIELEENIQEVVNQEQTVYTKVKRQEARAVFNMTEEHIINMERQDYIDRYEAMLNLNYLVPMTNSDYEIALADENGDYTFFDTAETIESAIDKSRSYANGGYDSDKIPCVINNDGVVVYSTSGVVNITGDGVSNINLYSDGNLSNAYTYVNPGYISDAPIIEENEKAIKIMANGFVGWINRNDIQVVPLYGAKNPSYYYSEAGRLYHYISTDVTGTSGNKGNKVAIGLAPTYLKEGTKYFSYDGNYFYDGNNIEVGLNNLINDLRLGNKNNCVNPNSPYYSYYQNLSFRSQTVYSAAQLDKFINENTNGASKLRGIGQALKNAEKNYGVNAILTLAVAINESGWGMSSIAQSKNNIFGLNAIDSNPGMAADQFPSVESCVNDFAKNWISKGYTNPEDYRHYGGHVGNKYRGINVKYASDPFWGEKAAQHALTIDIALSGDINSLNDTNYYQLGIYDSPNVVYNSSLGELYKVDNYWSYVGTPIVFASNGTININGQNYYQINPERNLCTPLPNKTYTGGYDWNQKGYISTTGVRMINVATDKQPKVTYSTHVEKQGWQQWKTDGQMAGTQGLSLRLEGIKIQLNNCPNASIRYSTHIQDIGWQEWKSDGTMSGTEGQSKRLEAIKIEANGLPDNLEIQYRVHVQDLGWQEWKYNGEIAGTSGQAKRLEGIEIRLVEKQPMVRYTTHVQNIGWQPLVTNGQMAGTQGKSLRLEGIKIDARNLPQGASIKYRTHIQDIGWQGWAYNGNMSGTEGQGKRLEGIQIALEGAPSNYHIEYRTHVQNVGWQEWKRDGQMSGTEGQSLRLEGIEIRIVID